MAFSAWSDSSNDRRRFDYGNAFKSFQQAEGFKDKFKRALFDFHRMEAMKAAVNKEKDLPNHKHSA